VTFSYAKKMPNLKEGTVNNFEDCYKKAKRDVATRGNPKILVSRRSLGWKWPNLKTLG